MWNPGPATGGPASPGAPPRTPDHVPGAALPIPVAALVPAPAKVAPTAPPSALDLLLSLRRRWKLALVAGPILAGVVAAAAWMLIPQSKYTARALLQVASTQPKVIFRTEESLADFATYQKTQLMMIKSRNVLSRALNDPAVSGLASVKAQVDPVRWLERRIEADYLGEVLRVSMKGEVPDDLAALVNATTGAYMKEIVDAESKERWARQDELKKIYNEYQSRLEQRRGELKRLAQRVGSKDKQTIRYSQELSMERLALARRELIQVQADLRKAHAELEIRKSQRGEDPAASVPSEAAIRQLIEEDEGVKEIRARIAGLQESVAKVTRVARDRSDPALQTHLQQIEAARKALNARYAAAWPQAVDRLSRGEPGSDRATVLEALKDRIEVLGEWERVTKAIVDAQSAENQEITQDSLYIDAIQDEIGHADTAAKRIGAELESLGVELRAPSRVRLFEAADAPRREEDKRILMTGAAGLGTFGLFMLGLGFVEYRTRRIATVDEVVSRLGLRVVGAVPLVRKGDRSAPRGAGPYGDDPLVESVDSIRTILLHSGGAGPPRSIMVASATSGECKTSLACHLATSLARSGLRTLLIDCDLRKPTVHRLYDLEATPGFCEYLRGEVDVRGVVRMLSADGPSVITAGACDASALKALARSDPGAIFEGFWASHDIIVVDTSPVLPVTDALLVGRHVDTAICSIRRDVSRLPWTLAAVEKLRTLDIRIIGAVVTGVKPRRYGTPYYYAGGKADDRHDRA